MRVEAAAQSWVLYGNGNIGQEVMRQLAQPEVAERHGLLPEPEYVVTGSHGVLTPAGKKYKGTVDTPEVAFVTIPSGGTEDLSSGQAAMNIMEPVLRAHGKVVTAEKGGMANHFDRLRDISDDFARLGVNATVGGGTQLMEVAGLYMRDLPNVTQIHMAVNGTLTNLLSEVGPKEGMGITIGQAVDQAIQLNFAEPGAQNPADVLAGEAAGDLPKKTAIFMSKLGLVGRAVKWDEFDFDITETDVARVSEEAKVRRAIVSLYHVDVAHVGPETDIIGGFDRTIDGWRVVAGFRDTTKNPLFANFAALKGAGNGIVIGRGPDDSDTPIWVEGQGAGVKPTVCTMLDDYLAMTQK